MGRWRLLVGAYGFSAYGNRAYWSALINPVADGSIDGRIDIRQTKNKQHHPRGNDGIC